MVDSLIKHHHFLLPLLHYGNGGFVVYYCYLCDYHEGQYSGKYIRLCRILTYFIPSPLFKGYDSLSENGKEIYDNLVLNYKK